MSGKKRKLAAEDPMNCKRIKATCSKDFPCEAWTMELMRMVEDIEPIAKIILEFSSGDWVSCYKCSETIDLVSANRESPSPGFGKESFCDGCVWEGTFSYWKLHKKNADITEYLFDAENEEDDH